MGVQVHSSSLEKQVHLFPVKVEALTSHGEGTVVKMWNSKPQLRPARKLFMPLAKSSVSKVKILNATSDP